MNFTINDVDEVIERTGCSYKEAKEALIKTNGDVVDAIILVQDESNEDRFRDFTNDAERSAQAVVDKIKEAVRKGDVTRIEVRDKDGRALTSVSVNVGAAIGAFSLLIGAAPLVVIGALVGRFGLNYRYVIIKEDGSETII